MIVSCGQFQGRFARSRRFLWGLTFDMSGGTKWAKPALGRPLDGGVSAHAPPTMTSAERCAKTHADNLASIEFRVGGRAGVSVGKRGQGRARPGEANP